MSDNETQTQPAPDTRNLHQRLADVSRECTYVQKDRPKGIQYAITSHDKVTAKVNPYLLKHGIVYLPTVIESRQDGNRTELKVETAFVNIDQPDDSIQIVTIGYGIDSQDKGPGKAMSYAVKFALLKTLGLATGEDADLESIEHEPAVEMTPGGASKDDYDEAVGRVQFFCSDRDLDEHEVGAEIKRHFKKSMREMSSEEFALVHLFISERFHPEAVST